MNTTLISTCGARRIGAVLALALSVGCRDTTSPPGEELIELPLVNRIVFQSNRADSLHDIWLMEADGSDPRALTDSATRDVCAALSPDGNWIMLHQLSSALAKTAGYPALQDSIVLMRADGTNRVALAQLERYAPYGAFCPQWAATSDRFVTASATEEPRVRSNQNYRVRVIDRSGNVLSTHNLSTLLGISLSSDGTRFLASTANFATLGAPIDVRVSSMRVDGTDLKPIGDGRGGIWSPAGNAVAWNCASGVCVSDPAGGNVRTLYPVTAGSSANDIRFSADGSLIAFGCTVSGGDRRSLCFADVATGSVEEIPVASGVFRIKWLADNASVVFECRLIGSSRDICLAKRGSGTFTNLTSHSADDAEPSAR